MPVVSSEPVIAPLDEALTAIKKLAADKPEAKAYHTRLADIFRMYVYRKKGILSLQETTAELVVQVSELGLPKDAQDELAQALRLGDFVKFAKFVPSNEENENALLVIKRSIERIEQLN